MFRIYLYPLGRERLAGSCHPARLEIQKATSKSNWKPTFFTTKKPGFIY